MDSYIICMRFGQEIKKYKNDLYLLCFKFFVSLQCSGLFSKKTYIVCSLGIFKDTLKMNNAVSFISVAVIKAG